MGQSGSSTAAGSNLEFLFLVSVIIDLMLQAHCALFGQPARCCILIVQLRLEPGKGVALVRSDL